MCKLDVLGFPLKEGIELLRELSDKEILIKETLTNKKNEEATLSEPRIIRCIESSSSIIVVISYF